MPLWERVGGLEMEFSKNAYRRKVSLKIWVKFEVLEERKGEKGVTQSIR